MESQNSPTAPIGMGPVEYFCTPHLGQPLNIPGEGPHQPKQHDNAVTRLRTLRLADSTRPFLARGHRVKRCSHCLLANCFCDKLRCVQSGIDFLLLFHRNELLKPTNTGRLIANCFPENTWAAVWHRTAPPQSVIQLLNNTQRRPILLFPGEFNPEYRPVGGNPVDCRPLLVIIDGTWKQARKIYLQSPWLHSLPKLTLNQVADSQYRLRQAPKENQVSTAEAAVAALDALNQPASANLLGENFRVFTEHYLAMRSNTMHLGQE